ncbi:MAG: TonB-dependent receptor domain-containing protein [Capsulimonadaceae bacterium]
MSILQRRHLGSRSKRESAGISAVIVLSLILACSQAAYADVFGRLTFTVKDADTNKPVANATVTLHDTAGVHGDIALTTDSDGKVTSPPLEIRPWEIATGADAYETDTRTFTVSADTTTPIEIVLAPKVEKVIKISASKTLVNKGKTASSTQRSQAFIAKTPSGNGNSQSLGNMLITNPGMVQSTNNQIHPRGEHASTTIDIDGAEIPDSTIGRGGQFLSPEVLQSADILTGAYAPEYGSEAAAVLNLNLRSGTITPFEDFTVQHGGYSTWDGDLTFGGQGGDPLEPGVDNGPKDFRYFVDLNNRSTANALEPPQPDDQTAHNSQVASTMLGHFDYLLNTKDQFSLTLNTTPATTEVANRSGLSGYYSPVGQGYGYGGARDANGYIPTYGPGSANSALGAYVPGLGSQEQDGQDDYQNDNNTFGLLNYRHTFDPETTGLVSFSQTSSVTELRNNNPAIAYNAMDTYQPNPALPYYDGGFQYLDGSQYLPTDNSIEFNPNMTRLYNQSQIQGSVTKSQGPHTFKWGAIYDDQTGQESYQFTPQSQLALDALGNIYESFGSTAANPFMPTGAKNTGVMDALGDPVWTVPAGSAFPTVTVHKTGYYGAAYLQDTWNATSRFTANYGFRYDVFHLSQSFSNNEGYGSSSSLTKGVLSPRINTAYTLAPRTIARLSYDHLFTQPPLAQGGVVGESIHPETWDQYEASVEKQVAAQQSTKLDYYYKNIRNQDDTGILIPYTQIGALTTLNYQYASVHGVEFSYDLTPRNNIGTGAFLAYTYSVAKPGGLNEVGAPAPIVNDHNQYDTLSTGINYTWRSQAYTSATCYFGSGEASSILGPVSTNPGPETEPVLDSGHTQPRTQVDLRLTSSPKMLGFAGLQLDVINAFDSLAVDNFNSGFSGTRFQQGRTFLLGMNAKF